MKKNFFFQVIEAEDCQKLSLLKREYLSSAVKGLKNGSKILHITQRNYFNLNYLHRDQ